MLVKDTIKVKETKMLESDFISCSVGGAMFQGVNKCATKKFLQGH